MIKFDLHIHSFASKYKEAKGIVDDSTIENAHVLLDKLNANNVALFSITDHNRFYVELYEKLDKLIAEGIYPNVKALIAGVEFDVQLDPEMGKCHIITIFDAKNKHENYKKIADAIAQDCLNSREDAYSKAQYENLLRKIGLDVILIACQRNSIERHDGHHNSLSESTMDAKELLKTGYINALEFQRPNVEGILRDNLRSVPVNVLLVMGSDCHEWTAYPNHDSTQASTQFRHSKANILPTFKGLLMAITSPETRINQTVNRNHDYIKNISVNGVSYPLVNGLNAIIGENGSGKSTLLKIMNGQIKESFVNKLKRDNNIICVNEYKDRCFFLKQGDIVSLFDNNKLFPNENFNPIDHSKFRNMYTEFANGILDYIKRKIKAKDAEKKLSQEKLTYNELIHTNSYFIHIDVDDDYSDVYNPHKKHDSELEKLLNSLEQIINEPYYAKYKSDLDTIYNLLTVIHEQIHSDNEIVTAEKLIKNQIISSVKNYDFRINEAATSQEKEKRDILDYRRNFIDYIKKAIQVNSKEMNFPVLPVCIDGFSTNPKNGFSFNSETLYHGKDVLDFFLTRMFTNSYTTIDALKKIDTNEELVSAVQRCTDFSQLEINYQHNLTKFLDEMCSEKHYIVDTSQGNKTLGSTLGELSLAYFRYMTEYEDGRCIFIIDQPEDHISNNNISKKLLKYFNSIRNKKQIIMVTHNPLLVVNQDVEQVLFVRKNGEEINIVSGCLEYEDDNTNILDIIAQNMDGGRASIEKRLRVYGKNN